jgi:hypothetical protein
VRGQYINRARGVGLEKLEAHWRDFYVLWDHFEIVAREVMSIGGIVVDEWPGQRRTTTGNNSKSYNSWKIMISLIASFTDARAGWCRNMDHVQAQPIEKSWRGSSHNPIALMYLEDKCADRNKVFQRERGDNRGGECEETENYATASIDAIRKVFLMCCGKITPPPHVNDTWLNTKRIVFNPCEEAAPSPEIIPFHSRFASRNYPGSYVRSCGCESCGPWFAVGWLHWGDLAFYQRGRGFIEGQ